MDHSTTQLPDKQQEMIKIREFLDHSVNNNLKQEIEKARDYLFQELLKKSTFQIVKYMLNNMRHMNYEKLYGSRGENILNERYPENIEIIIQKGNGNNKRQVEHVLFNKM